MTPKHKYTSNPSCCVNLLRMKRQQLGLKQTDVAFLMGLTTPAHISAYERGTKCPSVRRLIDFSIILHEPRLDALFPDLYAARHQLITMRRAQRAAHEHPIR